MMRKTLKFLIIMVTIAIIAGGIYSAGKASSDKDRREYFNRTEALLDSIYNWNPDLMDTAMETDVYYEYEVARDKIL